MKWNIDHPRWSLLLNVHHSGPFKPYSTAETMKSFSICLLTLMCILKAQLTLSYSILKLSVATKVRNQGIKIGRKLLAPLQSISSILTPEEFEAITTLSTSNVPCVIDFQKSECKPCKKIAPDYEALSEKYEGKASFFKIDADTSKAALLLMKANGIKSVPTFHVWVAGVKVDTVQGAHLDEVEETILIELGKQAL